MRCGACSRRLIGRVVFEVALRRAEASSTRYRLACCLWIWPWLVGITIISLIGRYGNGHNALPNWIDLIVVVVFSLAVFYYAVSLAINSDQVGSAIETEEQQIELEARLS